MVRFDSEDRDEEIVVGPATAVLGEDPTVYIGLGEELRGVRDETRRDLRALAVGRASNRREDTVELLRTPAEKHPLGDRIVEVGQVCRSEVAIGGNGENLAPAARILLFARRGRDVAAATSPEGRAANDDCERDHGVVKLHFIPS